MDKELLEFLKEFRDDVSKQFDNVSKQFDNVSEQISTINSKLEKVESKTDKNTLLLEGLKQDVKTLAEVQTSFSEQLERTKNKDGKCLADMKK